MIFASNVMMQIENKLSFKDKKTVSLVGTVGGMDVYRGCPAHCRNIKVILHLYDQTCLLVGHSNVGCVINFHNHCTHRYSRPP